LAFACATSSAPTNMIWDNMMWGSDYPHSESTFPQSRKILSEILEGVSEDEQGKIVGLNTARVYNFDAARLTVPA
jgi:predicted TIM-barrel fold metal-dependent hydrolase